MNKRNKPIELTDEQMEKVNGGMNIVVVKTPKIFDPILRFIFKVKKQSDGSQNTDTVINGPIIAYDNDNEK